MTQNTDPANLGRPTRSDLLAVIATLQGVFGKLQGAAGDQNPNRAAQIEGLTRFGFELCVEARSHDPAAAGSRTRWAKVVVPDLKEFR